MQNTFITDLARGKEQTKSVNNGIKIRQFQPKKNAGVRKFGASIIRIQA